MIESIDTGATLVVCPRSARTLVVCTSTRSMSLMVPGCFGTVTSSVTAPVSSAVVIVGSLVKVAADAADRTLGGTSRPWEWSANERCNSAPRGFELKDGEAFWSDEEASVL